MNEGKLPFEVEAEANAERQRKQFSEISDLHTIFIHDERARRLLDMWKRAARVRTPPGSPIDVYARKEAIREFVETIEDQVEIARRNDIFA
jgi:hypothetical protein